MIPRSENNKNHSTKSDVNRETEYSHPLLVKSYGLSRTCGNNCYWSEKNPQRAVYS